MILIITIIVRMVLNLNNLNVIDQICQFVVIYMEFSPVILSSLFVIIVIIVRILIVFIIVRICIVFMDWIECNIRFEPRGIDRIGVIIVSVVIGQSLLFRLFNISTIKNFLIVIFWVEVND